MINNNLIIRFRKVTNNLLFQIISNNGLLLLDNMNFRIETKRLHINKLIMIKLRIKILI